MGLFNKLFGLSEKDEGIEPAKLSAQDRRSIPAEEIDQMQRVEASEKYRKKIYRRYYRGYPEMPYISQDRELNTNWIDQAEAFPASNIIPKAMMIRYSDGLLAGHVYMLHWLLNVHRKRIPAYFEYKYGIDFVKEKYFLLENGFIDKNDKLTPEGLDAIERHKEVIDEHAGPQRKPKSELLDASKPENQAAFKAEVEGLLQIGMTQGKGSRELARRLRCKFDLPRADAEQLMVTELCRVQTEAARQSYIRNGNTKYRFMAIGQKPCPICQDLDGQVFQVKDMKPGVNAPPMHPNCHCTTAPYWDREEFERYLDEENRKMHERIRKR